MANKTSESYALISVSDKRGLLSFAKQLHEEGFNLLSTGRTADVIEEGGVPVVRVSDLTRFPEIMDGRVKTLHPTIFGGILANRCKPDHIASMEEHGFPKIDLVCVNLYPFEEVVQRPGVTIEDAIENIDIGGPSLLRAAAKNFNDVLVVCDVDDYDEVGNAIARGKVDAALRQKLALKVFAHTQRYDSVITSYLAELPTRSSTAGSTSSSASSASSPSVAVNPLPSPFVLSLTKVQDLRYGENPHQQAAFYMDSSDVKGALKPGQLGPRLRQLQGKELSYNNLLDLDAALRLVGEFKDTPAVSVIKHTNPSGCATATNLDDALLSALACDPVSAFGSIVAFNGAVDAPLAAILSSSFYEIIVAPSFDEVSLEILGKKKNLRIIVETQPLSMPSHSILVTSFGTLVQTTDPWTRIDASELELVTEVGVTDQKTMADLLFAWKVCKHVKSNAIVLAKDGATIGVGAGQMSRVDSVQLAISKANEHSPGKVTGSVLASDAFFPFPDGPELAAKAGVKAIIQPGGSKNDASVIDLCNQYGVAMYTTGKRHFKH